MMKFKLIEDLDKGLIKKEKEKIEKEDKKEEESIKESQLPHPIEGGACKSSS